MAEVFEAIRREVAAEHELPVDAIVLIKAGSIPKTSSGKIQRHACRQGSWTVAGRRGPMASGLRRRRQRKHGTSRALAAAAGFARRTASGARRSGAARHTGGEPGRGHRAHDHAPKVSDPIDQIVLERSAQVAKERAGGLTLDTPIVELGLDSLERMEILAALEEPFGGRFPEDVLPHDRNLPRSGRRGRNYLGKPRRKPAHEPAPTATNSRRTITASTSSPNTSAASRT